MRIDHDSMMRNFEQLRTEVNGGLTTVENQLAVAEYAKATESMEIISKRMAQTAVMMRTVMIKAGMIEP